MRTQPWETAGPLKTIFEAAEQRWLAHWRRGPSRPRWADLPPQTGAIAPDFELLDTDAQPIRLSSLWATSPALLLFWRHWGCGCGVGRAERLREEYPKLVEAGANVVVVGQGEPERAAWYREAFGIPAPIVVDSTGEVYEAYGLVEMSTWLLLGEPKPDMSVFESWIPEHREKGRPVADNPFLLPGEFVVNARGELVSRIATSTATTTRTSFRSSTRSTRPQQASDRRFRASATTALAASDGVS